MRPDHVFEFKHDFDLYVGTPDYDEQTGNTTLVYDFERADRGHVVVNPTSVVLSTRAPIPNLSTVKNLRDRNGVALSVHQRLYVTESQPVLSHRGVVVGYRHTLRSAPPRDWANEVKALIEAATN